MERIGKYHIRKRLGGGGMGELFLALDPTLDREVAIKVMSEDIMRDEHARARFYREAKAAARLQHRNIVTVYDFAHDGDIPYIVMEFLRGQNLADRLRTGPSFSILEKLDLGIQLCEGLRFAHGEGVVHRDIKPANIWLLEDGGVKLLDFGLAKSITGTLTHGSGVAGSAAYMSPEQIEGQPLEPRSDLFSVGAVLFELMSGQRAFDGPSLSAVMMKITQEEPAVDVRSIAPDVPAAVAAIVVRALQKVPADRYFDAAEMASDLRLARGEIADREDAGGTFRLEPSLYEDGNGGQEDLAYDAPSQTQIETRGSRQRILPGAGSADSTAESLVGQARLRPHPEPAAIPVGPKRRRSPLVVVVAAAAVVLAAVGVGVFMAGPRLIFGERIPPPLRLSSTPPGAQILVDGRDTGRRTPAEVQIDAFPADLRLELSGYQPFETRVAAPIGGVNAVLSQLPRPQPPSPPQPDPAPVVPAAPPKAPVPAPTPRAQLKILRSPQKYQSCNLTIGSWSGTPFDGVTVITVPARTQSFRMDCQGVVTEGTIEVPAGTNTKNFEEVFITLDQ